MDPITILLAAAATALPAVSYILGLRAGRRRLLLHDHILQALYESSGHGPQIAERIHARHGYFPSQGELYPLLRRMERDRDLTCTQEPGGIERNYLPRYVYTLVHRPRLA